MVLKKSKSSKIAKVIEAMKKKAVAGISGNEAPSVVPDTQPIKVDAVVGVTHCKQPPLSPLVEPLRKRQREVRVPVPSPVPPRALDIRSDFLHNYFEHVDDVAIKDLINQCLFQAINANTELKVKEPEVDWGWINDVYPDEGDEDEEGEEDANRPIDDLSPPRVETKVFADIHPISSKGQGAAGDRSTD
ncbi:hypothetical protein JCGZ_26504 [Jatropha curcas]|uniref:Uncharacterized protein n=1 Tax=Jatropha curcas TaxID=180498 RepID=A0A067JL37_JATCU|nr:hypothetical protein JCGZ_26504 [Jatropha curcas]